MMRINKKEDSEAVFLSYDLLENTKILRHGISTRCGGVSKGYLGSMNLSYTRGDRKENVDENFRRIADAIGFSVESLVLTDQTHTNNVRIVTKEDAGKGVIKDRDYSDIDGLVTNEKGVTLAGFYADCVPLLFADPVKEVIGVAHSGWRGTVGRIGKNVIELMTGEYGCKTTDIVVAIGPSICKDCYEVSKDVADRFLDEFEEHHSQIVKNGRVAVADGKKEQKYLLNLWEANRIVLLEAGVLSENIEMPGMCTNDNPQFLYSHRYSNGMRGNFGAFIELIS